MAYELGRQALLELVKKTNVPLSAVDHIIMGTVIQEVKTANIAREVSLIISSPTLFSISILDFDLSPL